MDRRWRIRLGPSEIWGWSSHSVIIEWRHCYQFEGECRATVFGRCWGMWHRYRSIL